MKDCILKAVKMINSNWFYWVLLSLTVFRYPKFEILFLVLGLILAIGVCSHFINLVKYGKDELTFWQNSGKHIFNFLIISMIINAPIFLVVYFINAGNYIQVKYIEVFVQIIIYAFTIYILPVVFIKRINLSAIPLGIKFLLKNFKYSLPLVFLCFLEGVVKLMGFFGLMALRKGIFETVFFVYIFGLIYNYLFLVVFISASIAFLKFSNEGEKKILEEN